MANTVNIRTLIDGPQRAVFHVYIASDNSSGELSDQVIVDVSALNPVPSKVSVQRIYGHATGFTGTFEFDASTDVAFMNIPNGERFDFCFQEYGGLKDNSGSGSTGDILLSTSGFTATGDAGWFVIDVKKT